MEQINFSTFPELQTDRLILRKLAIDDAPDMHKLRSDINVAALTGRIPSTILEESIAFIYKIEKLIQENESVYWVIAYKDSPAMLGAICLWNFDLLNDTVEVGYELLPEFQNKGIMTEAITAILNYAYSIDIKNILAFPAVENVNSIKLLEKTGFKLASGAYNNSHENVPGMLTFVISQILQL